MTDKSNLLTSKEMAQFVAEGYLKFENIIPEEINQATIEELKTPNPRSQWQGYNVSGTPFFSKMWLDSPGFGKAFRVPKVQGIIQSLVGANPTYDHHACHTVPPKRAVPQDWHADAIIDTVRPNFDIQIYYFPHDTPREMGGTCILPASHFRRVNCSEIGRYHYFVGQLPTVCKGGTMIFVHHGIWHRAEPNLTDNTRYMIKLRLNPTVKQVKLWNTDDINAPEIPRILAKNQPWLGWVGEDRLEVCNRIKLWRYLTDNPTFDVDYWLTRIENVPA
jgi:ectoine hydroxylase-related dioxygenase (phytanoyl-CoA dioxygenase family)